MSELIELENSQVPAALQALSGADNDDLSAGVSGGFSVLSIRGSKWRIKAGGDEHLVTNSEGDARSSLTGVLLKANKHISKNYYEGGYSEGSNEAPSCFSTNGINPDPSVENPVAPSCKSCPKNQFGSRITETGAKAKACSDSRRVAFVPEGDFANAQFGGPMLLRVPAASLSDLASYGKAIAAKGRGHRYNTIITRMSFDPETSYPKLKFKAVRPMTEEEGSELAGLLQDPEFIQKIEFILAEATELEASAPAPAAPVADDPAEFEVETPTEAEAPVKLEVVEDEPKKEPAPAKAKAEEKPKAEAEVATGGLDDELDSILSKLSDFE